MLTIILAAGFSWPAFSQQASAAYPRVMGYVGILHPLVTFGHHEPHYNFDGAYTVGLPTGINIWKNPGIGFSIELVPVIRASGGTGKMNNLLFHPGMLIGLGKGFTLAARAAFETSGRYGFTPVLNKIIIKGRGYNWFAALPVPARFGNDQPATIGVGLQFGIVF
ncbi:hypothetical protein EG028_10870 [Chitinophaga barathri]|uniref:Outer membrane protein beta-barrel domain-containing protein n=2 Tax=Chitinophaga barathri TaxID=1647451 RepID=A0A3N4MNT4_9BACT|nr:hypothetical protein EG028_10870 [Chitinophaga barathri]